MSQVSAPRLNEVPAPYVSITAAAKRCQTKWERIHRMIDSKLITAHTIDGWPHPVIHGDDIATITELIQSWRRQRQAKKSKRLGADLITHADAAARLGLSVGNLSSTLNRCGVWTTRSNGAMCVRAADLDRIREFAFVVPGPGDPTPEQIKQRCLEVRQRRCKGHDDLDAKIARLILGALSQGAMRLGRLRPAVGTSKEFFKVLNQLIESGRVIKSADSLPLYAIAGSDPSLESADKIMQRIRRRACSRSRRRSCVAA
ncbi:hypothetical protein U8335_11350 [Roseiconus lacunae]|uniref:hypothetical protein n=1 Tax=Roseiconus lacunae TaxID=2605694 RepID=UPI00308DDCFF|nr:hypothetical protein U8335_11350 [Stieleria sp. HD01]